MCLAIHVLSNDILVWWPITLKNLHLYNDSQWYFTRAYCRVKCILPCFFQWQILMSAVKSCGLCETTCDAVKLTFVCRRRTGDWPAIGSQQVVTRGNVKEAEVSRDNVVTSSTSWIRWRRTWISFPSLGDSSRKSITESMTTCFSGGVGRGSSSISASCLGVRRGRTSSCRGSKRGRCWWSAEEKHWTGGSWSQRVEIQRLVLIYPWEVSVELVKVEDRGESWEESKVLFEPPWAAIGCGDTLGVCNRRMHTVNMLFRFLKVNPCFNTKFCRVLRRVDFYLCYFHWGPLSKRIFTSRSRLCHTKQWTLKSLYPCGRAVWKKWKHANHCRHSNKLWQEALNADNTRVCNQHWDCFYHAVINQSPVGTVDRKSKVSQLQCVQPLSTWNFQCAFQAVQARIHKLNTMQRFLQRRHTLANDCVKHSFVMTSVWTATAAHSPEVLWCRRKE